MLGKQLQTAAAGNAGGAGAYIEDVFSTHLYTGTGSNQTITNGIDLAGEGGMVWLKNRNISYGENHALYDSERGIGSNLVYKDLSTDSTASQQDRSTHGVSAFNSDGFTVIGNNAQFNTSPNTYASWTFRKAEKFFDVVTYTGDGVAGREVSHNLGSTPGFIIVKHTGATSNWWCYSNALGATKGIRLDGAVAATTTSFLWNNTAPTSSVFTVGSGAPNGNGASYVAYLFAHDAGGFGDDGTESVIKCGSFTANSNGTFPTVNLGWEPQWLLVKQSDGASGWFMFDNMRGIATGGTDKFFYANYSDAETQGDYVNLTANGFTGGSSNPVGANSACIYIAIRRGPMKTPTSGTDVFQTLLYTGSSSNITRSTNITVDALFTQRRNSGVPYALDRMRGGTNYIPTNSTGGEGDQTDAIYEFGNDYIKMGAGVIVNDSTKNYCLSMFSRAPGFFDVVAYTGTGVVRTLSHNLGVAPELLFIKQRNTSNQWTVGSDALTDWTKYIQLSSTAGESTFTAAFNSTAPTSTVFTVGGANTVNESAGTYIAYLFATCPGVSKVGSYTGTASTLNIDCGFSAGARFVLIKRSDTFPATGDWYVWDSARGIVSGDDDYLLLNSSAAEVTNTDYIDPLSTGFQISSSAPAAINASGGSYIFLAIA